MSLFSTVAPSIAETLNEVVEEKASTEVSQEKGVMSTDTPPKEEESFAVKYAMDIVSRDSRVLEPVQKKPRTYKVELPEVDPLEVEAYLKRIELEQGPITPPTTMGEMAGATASDVATERDEAGITQSRTEPADVYEIKTGDNLSKIAKANNTTVAAIVELNDIENPDMIVVGERLVMPDPVSPTANLETAGVMSRPETVAEEAETEEPVAEEAETEEAETEETEEDTDLENYTSNYAEVYLKRHEGLKPHKSLEGGKDTAALGVKFSLGLKRSDYDSDAEFAGAVALKHRDKAKAKFGAEKWDNLPESVRFAMTDLNYNTGTIGSSGNKATTLAAMKNTLDFIGMTTKAGEKASLISLATRRAWNWNKAASDIGQSKITKIKQIPTANGGTKFEYIDAAGNVVHSLTTSRKPVKLKKDGTAITLTTTREITL